MWGTLLFEKPEITQLLHKFPAFRVTCKGINHSCNDHTALWTEAVNYSVKLTHVGFTLILSSDKVIKWCFQFRFPDCDITRISDIPMPATRSVHPNLPLITLRVCQAYFKVRTAVLLLVQFFWFIMLCRLIKSCRRFEVTKFFRLQGQVVLQYQDTTHLRNVGHFSDLYTRRSEFSRLQFINFIA